MANPSELTRKDQVRKVLMDHLGLWVDGTLLANEEVGGSEGLKRLRELRQDLQRERALYHIQQRKHPEAGRSIYQYRLVEKTSYSGQPETAWAPKQEVPRATYPAAQPAAPRSNPAPRPMGSPPTRGFWQENTPSDTASHDWHPAKKAPGTLEYVFWIGKQRVIGGIAPLGDDRWGWGVVVPANKKRMRPEERAGHGAAPDKDSARMAVEARVREMRETGDYR